MKTTFLEHLRTEMGWAPSAPQYAPAWHVVEVDARWRWLLDGDRAVALLDAVEDNFELRVADPWSSCPPAVIPKHYHIVSYTGLRAINKWYTFHREQPRTASRLNWKVDGETACFTLEEDYADGSFGTHEGKLVYDPAWGRYVVEITAKLTARRVLRMQEFVNLIPANIGDTRPGRAKYQQVVWLDRDNVLRGMGKNPLWFTSVGAQDLDGRRGIPVGGFLGWIAEPDFNPVIEIRESTTGVGAGTCDALMDEHMMLAVPDAAQCPDGWFHLHVKFRLFSLPAEMATHLAARTTPLEFGPMLAWKFQYAPHEGPIGKDLNRIELPGIETYGTLDMNTPVPWDRPFFGQLWTPSNHPDADLFYDTDCGHAGQRSLRIKVDGKAKSFCPGSGPTMHTEEGRQYRVGAWIRTEGDVTAWVEGNEILFNTWNPVTRHATPSVGAQSDWTWVETAYVARGDNAPFAAFFICAEGTGLAWFDELTFVAV